MASEFPKPNYIGDKIRIEKYLRKYLLENFGGRLLDVGAGNGQAASVVSGKGYVYTGVDIRPCHPDIVKGDAENLWVTFPDKKFNTIICIDTLEHLERPEMAVLGMKDLLCPDGFVMFHVPNSSQTHILVQPEDQADHKRHGFSEDDLRLLFKDFKLELYPTFTPIENLAWELVYCSTRGIPIDLNKLIDFSWDNYQHLGWLGMAWK